MRYDREWKKKNGRVPVKSIAEYAGVRLKTLRKLICPDVPASPETVSKVSDAIQAIESGEIRAIYKDRRWKIIPGEKYARPDFPVPEPELPECVQLRRKKMP